MRAFGVLLYTWLLLLPSVAAGESFVASTGSGSARFPLGRIEIADSAALRPLLSTGKYATHSGKMAFRKLGRGSTRIAKQVHLLMHQPAESYEKVVLMPSAVALVRKDGVVDVINRKDAEAQIASGQPVGREQTQVGIKPRGFPVLAEHGPNNTYRLYRQLPLVAHGEIASKDGHTSFALSGRDAYHPFGEAGKTVTLSVPRHVFDAAMNGELGGAGWAGTGPHLGIDVVEEIQIDSGHVRKHTPQ